MPVEEALFYAKAIAEGKGDIKDFIQNLQDRLYQNEPVSFKFCVVDQNIQFDRDRIIVDGIQHAPNVPVITDGQIIRNIHNPLGEAQLSIEDTTLIARTILPRKYGLFYPTVSIMVEDSTPNHLGGRDILKCKLMAVSLSATPFGPLQSIYDQQAKYTTQGQ